MKGVYFLLIAILLISCSKEAPLEKGGNMKLTSTAFNHEEPIPAKYTCQGEDISPQLQISEVPENTQSLVLIMDDPDAPMRTWDHWVAFNIDPSTAELAERAEPGIRGTNSWGRTGYGGPCPPSGTHRYFFKLYALDITLGLEEGADKAEVEAAMEGHVLAKAVLMGTYQKS